MEVTVYKSRHNYRVVCNGHTEVINGKKFARCSESELKKVGNYAKAMTDDNTIAANLCAFLSGLILGQEHKQSAKCVKNGTFKTKI